MAATVPPLAAMITATRSSARSKVFRPVVLASRSAVRAVIPAGSRTRPISSARPTGAGVVSSQGRPGRITSPPISCVMPAPSRMCRRASSGLSRPASSRPLMTRSRQSPDRTASAPEESHRCCHVCPGCSSSQSRSFRMPSLRACRELAPPRANGGASILRATVNRSADVSGQDSGTGRGGNLSNTASASALSCPGRAAARAVAAAVTSGPSRTSRPGSPPGNPAPAGRAGAEPAACGEPGRPRSRPRRWGRRRAAWSSGRRGRESTAHR